MVSLALAFISVVLFCLSARKLMESIVVRVGYFDRTLDYSRFALKIERKYRIFAWSCLTLLLFYSMVIFFFETFMTL